MQIGTLNPCSGMHTYEIVFRANGAGAADDTVAYRVDSVDQFTVPTSNIASTSGPAIAYFGSATGASGYSDSQYALVLLETVTTIPQPSSFALIGLGALLLRLRRHRC